jgi:protein-ribulosamine 3-kinase
LRDWSSLKVALQEHGLQINGRVEPRPVGGGSISSAWQVEHDGGHVFLKTAAKQSGAMLEAESDGLNDLRRADEIRVPEVLASGATDLDSFLALEWLNLDRTDASIDRQFGRQLALLHRHNSDRFGWRRDNTIGSTPQKNAWRSGWVEFFLEQRLQYQLELALENGFGGELGEDGETLISQLPAILDGHNPLPSLLHGDLWGGNYSSVGGCPVIYDPAVYYGDRETDLAMSRLFGGFGDDFYTAYEESWPLPEGAEQRVMLYQLYHVLNHVNLFGRPYLVRASALIRSLLRAVH